MGKQLSSIKCNKYDEPGEQLTLLGSCLFCRVASRLGPATLLYEVINNRIIDTRMTIA
jgi:hypothetical protein